MALCLSAFADHGPGTSGGGFSTPTGETLKARSFAADFRADFTKFRRLSDFEIDRKATDAGEIDLLDQSLLGTASLNYGLTTRFQVGLSLGFYNAFDAQSVEFDSETEELEEHTFNPDGTTDLWLTGKYRFYRGPLGSFAVLGGFKSPTGKSNAENSSGESLEPSATSGSGSFDGLFGVAYSRFLTPRLTLDAGTQYTHRGSHHGFKVGDRLDGGVALAYRLSKSNGNFPDFSLFTEGNIRHLLNNEESSARILNSGGTVVFISPGVRAAVDGSLSFTLSPSFPIIQELNGTQLQTSSKINFGMVLTF